MIDLRLVLAALDAFAAKHGHPGARVGINIHAVHDERTCGTYAEIGLYVFAPDLVHVHAHKTLEAAFVDLDTRLKALATPSPPVDLGEASAVRLPGDA